MAAPLGPAPATFTGISWSRTAAVFYPGESVSCTLSKTGATAYSVRNLDGTILVSGAVSGLSLSIPAPTGGWKLGWYRVYLTGPTFDAVFGYSYGVSNFVFINSDARFPTSPAPGSVTFHGEAADYSHLICEGVFSYGPVRANIADVTGAAGHSPFDIAGITAFLPDWQAWYGAGVDANRTAREALVAFPNGTVDFLEFQDTAIPAHNILSVYCKDETLDGSQVFVQFAAGTTSGVKLTVCYPNSTTVVATYDNLASAVAIVAATAADTHIKCFNTDADARLSPPATGAQQAIGNTKWTGTKTTVSTLFGLGAKWFEGPENEPPWNGPETAHRTRLFAGAVHAGNAAAKAVGPSQVNANLQNQRTWWTPFFNAGGGGYLDALSTHCYNMQIDDLYLGKRSWAAFRALINSFGLSAKPLWQTENGQTFVPSYAVYHPKRAVRFMRDVLLAEQVGIPRERHIPFNDTSHGFWDIPCWITNGGADATVNPQAPMMRTLAEETYGRPFASALDFGTPGNTMYLGSVYTSPTDGTSRVVLIGATVQISGQVTVSLGGTIPATVTAVDCFGNTSTLTVTGGRVTVPVQDRPVYVRLGSGVTATAYSFGDWPPLGSSTLGNHLPNRYSAICSTSGAETRAVATTVIDATWGNTYGDNTESAFLSMTTGLPAWWQLQLPNAHRFDRVTIWGPPYWQGLSRPVDFDIQTSNNGSSWTTIKTLTASASSFLHGAGGDGGTTGTGTQYETYDDETRIFDVKLAAPVSAQYVRIYVRDTTYGGEPDLASASTGNAQSASSKQLCLQQVALYCDDTATARYIVVSGGSTI